MSTLHEGPARPVTRLHRVGVLGYSISQKDSFLLARQEQLRPRNFFCLVSNYGVRSTEYMHWIVAFSYQHAFATRATPGSRSSVYPCVS